MSVTLARAKSCRVREHFVLLTCQCTSVFTVVSTQSPRKRASDNNFASFKIEIAPELYLHEVRCPHCHMQFLDHERVEALGSLLRLVGLSQEPIDAFFSSGLQFLREDYVGRI